MKAEVQTFADVNVAWLAEQLAGAGIDKSVASAHAKAQAIFASVAGAQLMARSRCDLSLFDTLIESYRSVGLIPRA